MSLFEKRDQNESAKRKLLWMSMAFLVLGEGLLLFLLSGARVTLSPHVLGVGFELAAAGLGVWLVLIVVWWVRRRGRLDLFELPVWISLNVYVQIILNTWFFRRDEVSRIPWVQTHHATVVPVAVLLFGVALTSLWVGYAWVAERARRKRMSSTSRSMNPSRVAVVWFATWIVANISVVLGTSTYLGKGIGSRWANYLQFIEVIGAAATYALVIHHFRRPKPSGWIWLALVYGSGVVTSLVFGSKGFAYTFLWLAACIYYARQKIPTRWLLAGFVIIVVLVPVVNRFRSNLWSAGRGQGVAFSDRLPALKDALADSLAQPIESSLEETRDVFESRQGSMLDTTASVLYLHPSHMPFLGREMLDYFIDSLVPRIVWPDKPTGRASFYQIMQTYLGIEAQGFAAIGLVADSYRAGGWLFVAVWFLALGALGGWFYAQGPGSGSAAGTVLYIVLLANLFRYDGAIVTVLLDFFRVIPLIWLIVMRVLFSPLSTEDEGTENLAGLNK